MHRVDVIRALTSYVQPVLGGLEGRIRHHPIRNFVNKMSQFSRYRDVDLWNKVVEHRADDEIGSSGVAGATPLDVQDPAQEDDVEFSTSNDA